MVFTYNLKKAIFSLLNVENLYIDIYLLYYLPVGEKKSSSFEAVHWIPSLLVKTANRVYRSLHL